MENLNNQLKVDVQTRRENSHLTASSVLFVHREKHLLDSDCFCALIVMQRIQKSE